MKIKINIEQVEMIERSEAGSIAIIFEKGDNETQPVIYVDEPCTVEICTEFILVTH